MDLMTTDGAVLPADEFLDVPPAHRFAREIRWVHRLGLLDPIGDGTFRPLVPVTRQDLARALYRYAGNDADERLEPPSWWADTLPRDVAPHHPRAAEIAWVLGHRLMRPEDDGAFEPARPVRRAELVRVLHRAAGAPATAGAVPFRDVPPWHVDAPAIAWAAEHGVVRGFPDGTFRPSRTVTRQALAVLLHRVDQLV